jgi:hypothetical protein
MKRPENANNHLEIKDIPGQIERAKQTWPLSRLTTRLDLRLGTGAAAQWFHHGQGR